MCLPSEVESHGRHDAVQMYAAAGLGIVALDVEQSDEAFHSEAELAHFVHHAWLKLQREILYLVFPVERTVRVAIYVIVVVGHTEREHWAEACHPFVVTAAQMQLCNHGDVEKSKTVDVGTVNAMSLVAHRPIADMFFSDAPKVLMASPSSVHPPKARQAKSITHSTNQKYFFISFTLFYYNIIKEKAKSCTEIDFFANLKTNKNGVEIVGMESREKKKCKLWAKNLQGCFFLLTFATA